VFWKTTLTIKAETEGSPPIIPKLQTENVKVSHRHPQSTMLYFRLILAKDCSTPHTKTGAPFRQRSLCLFCPMWV